MCDTTSRAAGGLASARPRWGVLYAATLPQLAALGVVEVAQSPQAVRVGLRCLLALGVLLGLGLSTGLQLLRPWHGYVFTLAEGVTRPSGGTVVVGLDQEPPNLDPHASPSAVTF